MPAKLRRQLPNHEVRTAGETGWAGVKNGKLLALAGSQFDAFVTVDKNMRFQQNLATLPVAVFILDATSNELQVLARLLPELERALASIEPRTLTVVRNAALELPDVSSGVSGKSE